MQYIHINHLQGKNYLKVEKKHTKKSTKKKLTLPWDENALVYQYIVDF